MILTWQKGGTAAWDTSGLVARFDANGMELRGDIIFEGSTPNNSETTLTVTDPTADRTVTIPNASGTVVLQDSNGDISVANGDKLIFGSTGNTYITGEDSGADSFEVYTDGSNRLTVDQYGVLVANGLPFAYQNAAGTFYTNLEATDPTADRTITFPNATGTVWTSGNDGAGSGLDADTLDGVQGSSYLRSDTSDTFTGTLTVNGNAEFRDNDKIIMGASDDLQMYSNGSNSIIQGNYDLYLFAVDDLFIRHGTASSSENMIACYNDSTVVLYHNNIEKLRTATGGIDVSGYVYTDSGLVHNGDTNNYIAFGTDTQYYRTNGTVRLDITNSGVRIASAYTLPNSDGTDGQAIVTDGSGNLSFSDAGISTGKAIAMAIVFG